MKLYHIVMRRFVVFLIVSALFLGQGFSVAAAMCRHGGAHNHAMALRSRDGSVAAAAKAEETAASVVDKKGELSAGNALYSVLADLPPGLMLADRSEEARALPWPAGGEAALKSSGLSPLLRPPLA
jgi:hypothetical protein